MAGVTYQQEFLDSVIPEIKPLLDDHWKEIANHKDKIRLNPDWVTYKSLEADGGLKIFTARSGGNLIGYFVVVVNRGLHYRDHLFATNDVIFLTKEYRNTGLGHKLIEFAEKCLSEDGVTVLAINTKVNHPFDGLMEQMDYRLTERVYTKVL